MNCGPDRQPERACREVERAFTLVELTIVVFISMAVLAIVVSVLLGALRGQQRVDARASAIAQVELALQGLQNDVTSMRAADRATGATYDAVDFASSIRGGGPLRGFDAAGNGPQDLAIHDLVVASSNQLVFALDEGDGRPGCVRWIVDSNGALVRERLSPIGRACSPAGAVSSRRVVVDRLPDTARAPFSFILSTPRASGDSCVDEAPISATLDPAQRGRVTTIRADIVGTVATRQATNEADRSSTYAIRSRRSAEYLRALGCVR
jgi:type II secretory pathway pseudopilin PulG